MEISTQLSLSGADSFLAIQAKMRTVSEVDVAIGCLEILKSSLAQELPTDAAPGPSQSGGGVGK